MVQSKELVGSKDNTTGNGVYANNGFDRSLRLLLHERLKTSSLKDLAVRYWRSFSFVGLIFASLFFSASVTPSLLPRNYVVQGLLSGMSIAVGYGIGVLFVFVYRFLEFPVPNFQTQKRLRVLIALIAASVFLTFIWRMTFWQNSIRQLMEMPRLESAYPVWTAAIAILFAVLLVAAGRGFLAFCRFFSRRLENYVPRRVAMLLGFVITVTLVLFVSSDLVAKQMLHAADSFFLNLDEINDEELGQPEGALSTGSSASLVEWSTIGRQGKKFSADRPDPTADRRFFRN